MSKQYIVFKTIRKKVYYETGDGWTENRAKAIRFSIKKAAETYMRRYVEQTGNAHYGVVDADVNTQVLRTLSEKDVRKNPARKKRTVKRAKKKTTRRKSPTRSAKSHLWRVFKFHTNGDVKFLGYSGTSTAKWVTGISDAILFKSMTNAKSVANNASNRLGGNWIYGIANANRSIAHIRKACKPGK